MTFHRSPGNRPPVRIKCQGIHGEGLAFFSKTGLPIGLMIAGPHFSESRVLVLANAYEKATDWHKR